MKKLFSILLAAAMVMSLAACGSSASSSGTASSAESKKVLKVGMECAYAPYNWTQTDDSNNAVKLADGSYANGYDVQIARRIAEGLGMELQVVKTEWDGLLPGITSGKIDLIVAGMSPTAERKQSIDFTDDYYQSQLVLVVRADGKYANATKLADFSGAKVCGQLNTFHDTVIDQIPGVDHVTPLEDFPSMIIALQSGKIDAYVSERPGAVAAKAANPDLTYVELTDGFTCDPSDTSIAIGLAKNSPLTAEVNKVLAGISQDERNQMMDDAVANQPLSN